MIYILYLYVHVEELGIFRTDITPSTQLIFGNTPLNKEQTLRLPQ